MSTRVSLILVFVALCGVDARAQGVDLSSSIDSYVQPYVQTRNFSGVVLVERNGKAVFERAYGLADQDKKIRNSPQTRFHVASISMQFTAVAVLRLIDEGQVRLEDPVAQYVPGIPGAEKITVRDLLVQRSGLPDINSMPDYDDVLQQHQTPESLVVHIQGQPLQFEPGTKFVREEHSAYNLLALIIEKKTGLPFKDAMQRLVFEPFGLAHSGIDDDFASAIEMAKGYAPERTYGLKPAKTIHWSGKTGNASAFATASDQASWVLKVFHGDKLSVPARDAILDTSMKVGYGWMRGRSERFGGTAYYMNGRAPGFASFVLYLPESETTVVVLSNIYSSATTTIGYDIAATALGLPYEQFAVGKMSASRLNSSVADFQFGADFYQASARVKLRVEGSELFLVWPSGDRSALIPMEGDRFLDRSYWEEVRIERDDSGAPRALTYDHFRGEALPSR